MPRFVKGDHVVETASPRIAVQLKNDGYAEQKSRTRRVKKAEAQPEATEETQAVAHEDAADQETQSN